jgi:hypothetical protein
LLDAGEELIDAGLGVIAGHCPHCQGNLELMPSADRLDVGYLNKSGSFDVVLSLPLAGLAVEREPDGDVLVARTGDARYWKYAEAD